MKRTAKSFPVYYYTTIIVKIGQVAGKVAYEKIPHAGIRIDTDAIPDHVHDDLAVAMLDFVRRTM